jgi:threonine dehydratase
MSCNFVEGAGAIALAGPMHERQTMKGKRVGAVFCGANIFRPLLADILADNL